MQYVCKSITNVNLQRAKYVFCTNVQYCIKVAVFDVFYAHYNLLVISDQGTLVNQWIERGVKSIECIICCRECANVGEFNQGAGVGAEVPHSLDLRAKCFRRVPPLSALTLNYPPVPVQARMPPSRRQRGGVTLLTRIKFSTYIPSLYFS